MVEDAAGPGVPGPKGDPGPAGPAGAPADMVRVAALEAAVASLILAVTTLQTVSGKLSAGEASVPVLLPGRRSTVSVALRPAQADTGYIAVALVAGGAGSVGGLSVVSTTVVSGARVDVMVEVDGPRPAAGTVVVLAVRA
jgi:hypothetical protein